jgi:hypothetical protein
MNRFERWFMNRIIRREVRQGFDHHGQITELYRMIRMACENEFYEDNLVTQNSYLREWFENSLRKLSK